MVNRTYPSSEYETGANRSLPKPVPLFTVDQYLAMERKAKERHEYIDGQIIAMAGESGRHGDISVNVLGLLYNVLPERCRARTKDTKVRSGPVPQQHKNTLGLYSYPDIVVVCGEPEYHDAFTDVLINPTAIVEVLSPATEAFDRGEKFNRYNDWNPSLKDYVLVSQDVPQVEVYSRQADGSWSIKRYKGLDAEAFIPSLECTLNLAAVYRRISFSEQAPLER